MDKIAFLPKFYDRSAIKEKYKELKEAKAFLLQSGKLTSKERDDIVDDIDEFMLIKGTYSRNYVIRKTNTLLEYITYRK